MPGDEELQRSHIQMLAELEASTKSAHKRMDNLEKFTGTFNEVLVKISDMNGNIKVLVEKLDTIVSEVAEHREAITHINKIIEPKDSINRIHGRLDEIEDRMNQEKINEQNAVIGEMKRQEAERKREQRGLVYAVVGGILVSIISAALIATLL